MKLIAENLPLFYNTIYKPKKGHIIHLNLKDSTWKQPEPSEKELKFLVFEELSLSDKEVTWQTNYVNVIWIDSDGQKNKTAMPAYEFANSYPYVEPVTSKKEIAMCMIKGLI